MKRFFLFLTGVTTFVLTILSTILVIKERETWDTPHTVLVSMITAVGIFTGLWIVGISLFEKRTKSIVYSSYE